ncbi:MAG: hypothetical protein NTX42_11535 [Methanothrix sp.]|nr:hypothetical protein [Methanothrix sp.]
MNPQSRLDRPSCPPSPRQASLPALTTTASPDGPARGRVDTGKGRIDRQAAGRSFR